MKKRFELGENTKYWLLVTGCFILMALLCQNASAEDAKGWGQVAGNLTSTFENLGKLITGGSYLAGLGFSIGAILQFKQHKDNPSQTPIGKPIALVFIAAALLFLPSVMETTGQSMFGTDYKTATPKGTEITGPGGSAAPK